MKNKKWTVLIYAAGNNELEPEIWRSVQLLEKIVSPVDVNVIIQIGRAEKQLVKLFRPAEEFTAEREIWSGVRRYILHDNHLMPLTRLGELNLADPLVLYDFVEWGMHRYPADHYILLLSGHGYQFIGALTDYSQSRPCIMGLPEMSCVLNMATRQFFKKIDILIADICYFNFIEIIFQFATNPDHAVQHIITYITDGPLSGLNYPDIIHILESNYQTNSIEKVITDIINQTDVDLIAVKLNYEKMEKIKNSISELAGCYLKIRKKQQIELKSIFRTNDSQFCSEIIRELRAVLHEIIIDYKINSQGTRNLLDIAACLPPNLEKISYYYKLDFCRENLWFDVLAPDFCKRKKLPDIDLRLEPIILSREAVKNNIRLMNEELAENEIETICTEVYDYKEW